MKLRAMLVISVVALAATAFAGYDVTEEFDQVFPLDVGGRVSLDNVNGDVTIEVWGRDEVRVQAVKRAGSQETLDKLEIEIDASGDRVRIHTEYPKWNGSWSGKGHRAEVEYTVTVPQLSRLDAVELVNGDLRISGVEGGVSAENVNGVIEAIGVAGEVELSVVNGNVEARFLRLDPRDEIQMESVNGRVELFLPAGAAADVEAKTVNGNISNDFGLEVVKGKYVGATMRGTIGSGGARINLETVNGKISLNEG
jgi:DUF4097 and DUF4098 domain-containing protein YvlB